MDFCGVGVGLGVGAGVGLGVGFGVGAGVGLGVGFGVATGLEELPPEELPPEEPLLPPVEGLLEELPPLLPVEGFLEELPPLLPVEGLLEELPPLLPVEGLLEELPPLLPVEGLPEELLSPLPDTLLVGSASLSGFSDSFWICILVRFFGLFYVGGWLAVCVHDSNAGGGVRGVCHMPCATCRKQHGKRKSGYQYCFFHSSHLSFFLVEIISTDQIMVNCIYRAVLGSSDGPPSLWEH